MKREERRCDLVQVIEIRHVWKDRRECVLDEIRRGEGGG